MRGRPLTLRCPKCKAGENHRSNARPSGSGIEVTGRGPRAKWVGRRHRTRLVMQIEVRHARCGWTWWTDHPAAHRAHLAVLAARMAPTLCGVVHRGLVCTRKAGHGGKLHVARGLGNRFLRSWPVAPKSK